MRIGRDGSTTAVRVTRIATTALVAVARAALRTALSSGCDASNLRTAAAVGSCEPLELNGTESCAVDWQLRQYVSGRLGIFDTVHCEALRLATPQSVSYVHSLCTHSHTLGSLLQRRLIPSDFAQSISRATLRESCYETLQRSDSTSSHTTHRTHTHTNTHATSHTTTHRRHGAFAALAPPSPHSAPHVAPIALTQIDRRPVRLTCEQCEAWSASQRDRRLTARASLTRPLAM